jgi:hypothetical protein
VAYPAVAPYILQALDVLVWLLVKRVCHALAPDDLHFGQWRLPDAFAFTTILPGDRQARIEMVLSTAPRVLRLTQARSSLV